jgi:serine/threonine protein phosphatase PrpC
MFTFSEYTNIGSRQQNEDNLGVACHGESYCFVVADGLGGHGGGEVASKIAVDTVCDLFVEKGWSENFFEQAFSTVQESILEEQERQHTPSRMKTTLVILVIHEDRAYYAHVGDSRLYYFKNNKVRKRTLDHSVPQMLALSGEIKESEIRHHPDRNRLIRVLGVKGESPRYEVGDPIKISGNQSFLLCTDGYWELIEEKQMENHLVRACDVSDWIKKMNQDIDNNGKGTDMDNYTCVAVLSHTKRLFNW